MASKKKLATIHICVEDCNMFPVDLPDSPPPKLHRRAAKKLHQIKEQKESMWSELYDAMKEMEQLEDMQERMLAIPKMDMTWEQNQWTSNVFVARGMEIHENFRDPDTIGFRCARTKAVREVGRASFWTREDEQTRIKPNPDALIVGLLSKTVEQKKAIFKARQGERLRMMDTINNASDRIGDKLITNAENLVKMRQTYGTHQHRIQFLQLRVVLAALEWCSRELNFKDAERSYWDDGYKDKLAETHELLYPKAPNAATPAPPTESETLVADWEPYWNRKSMDDFMAMMLDVHHKIEYLRRDGVHSRFQSKFRQIEAGYIKAVDSPEYTSYGGRKSLHQPYPELHRFYVWGTGMYTRGAAGNPREVEEAEVVQPEPKPKKRAGKKTKSDLPAAPTHLVQRLEALQPPDVGLQMPPSFLAPSWGYL